MRKNPFRKKKYSYGYRKKSQRGEKSLKNKLFSKKDRKKTIYREDKFKYPKKRRYFNKRSVYVDSYRSKNRKAWILPIVAVVMITAFVFWIGPLVLSGITSMFTGEEENTQEPVYLYDAGDWRVITKRAADVFKSPDLRAERITQVLYNEPVEVLDANTFGFVRARLRNGAEGYIMTRDLTTDAKSVEPYYYSHKIVITAKSKRIMSHSSRGSLLAEVSLGTVLFSDYRQGNVYRVVLPGNEHGWISASGIIRIEPEGQIEMSSGRNFYETALSFNNTVYLRGGITPLGADIEGIAYISAKVNGVKIPPLMEDQIEAGQKVDLVYDEERENPFYDNLEEGDLVFFGNESESERTIIQMGIIVGYGQVLAYSRGSASIRILNIDNNRELSGNIIEVRRIF